MSFLKSIFGEKKRNGKEAQLEDLKTRFPEVRFPQQHNSTAEIVTQIQGQFITLRIHLGPQFPASAPVSSLLPSLYLCLSFV
jgi:hypothetical protein